MSCHSTLLSTFWAVCSTENIQRRQFLQLHLVTAIVASNWISNGNYFELVKMYVLLAAAATCYQARWKKQRKRQALYRRDYF